MRQMLPVLGLLISLALCGCASSNAAGEAPVDGLTALRQECIKNNGVFRVMYKDYPIHGWTPEVATCWYGASTADIERAKTLD